MDPPPHDRSFRYKSPLKAFTRQVATRVGMAVHFPRILRWRHDKPATEADTLETVRVLLDRRTS